MITYLFKQSLDISELPPEWKTAYVTPIFKKDKRSDPSNYQPVSSTSILCKTFEHILVSQIMNYLETHQMLCPISLDSEQNIHVNHSYQLLLMILPMLSTTNYKQLDIGILEFSKAFDKVSHTRKLEYYGIRGKPLRWIRSFLSYRS